MKKLSVTATGDSLFVNRLPEEYNKINKEVKDFINSCDIKITNLETNLSDFDLSPNAYSGGTWLNTRRKYIKFLADMGFNYFGNANNHCMDYGHEGLLSTIETLDSFSLAHSGTGRTLSEADTPAIIKIGDKKVAVFAVDSSMEVASMAGEKTKYLKGRAGVSYLRHTNNYKVSEEELNQLKQIAFDTHINYEREFEINTGYGIPDKEGEFNFNGAKFTTDKSVKDSCCNPTDLKRITDNVKKAKAENDYVFMLIHCHDSDNISHSHPSEYLKEFCKSVIDAGVSAVFGGGCHELRGIEIYKGYPIFYSLGDFFYQGLMVEYLPADFMLKYGIDINSTAKEALWARSRGGKVGLHLMKENYLTVLPKLEFEGDKLVSLKMMPVYLNFEEKGELNGLPVYSEKNNKEIFDAIDRLSKPFNTQMVLENGLITVKI